jgi:dihydropteroate synthase
VVRRKERFVGALEAARERRGVALMGVCNVTPDSFSDGGRFFSRDDALARVGALLDEGADFVDVGGESTRPGAAPVGAREQIERTRDVVSFAAERGACVSIDTASAEVAAACLDAGACAVNDVSCLRDAELASVCAASGAVLILMHARAMSEMRGFSEYPASAYGDVVDDVLAEWEAAAQRAVEKGLPRDALVMDPGLGFTKNARQSAELLSRVAELGERAGAPVLIGASRKSFLTVVDEGAPPAERFGSSIAAALWAARRGASILRVHDVRATRQAIDLERVLDTGRDRKEEERRC